MAAASHIRAISAVTGFAVLATSCGDSKEKPDSGRPYRSAYTAVCRAASELRAGRIDDAKADFFDRAHQPIHVLAQAAGVSHRDVAARLLEAKQPLESGLVAPDAGPQLATAADRLSRVMADAIAVLGDRPDPCADQGATNP